MVRTTHRIEREGPGRSRVIYRIVITGPEADTLGPEISADFPQVLAALVEAAER